MALTPTHPIIVAEISANHRGSKRLAMALLEEAKRSGADAVKIQVWHPDYMAAPGHIMASGPWAGKDLAALYREAYLPWDWLPEMFQEARMLRIILFASVFDIQSLKKLEELDCAAYKIASFELVDLPLIAEVASKRKPLILSTGMATYDEIRAAVKQARKAGAEDITLLKCTSAYPAKYSSMNLRAMPELGRQFGTKFGLSDHSLGSVVPIMATAMGADMIEKHFCLTKEQSLDGGFSMSPLEFAAMVSDVRQASEALGSSHIGPDISEQPMRALRRSLHYSYDLTAGHILTDRDMRSMRPSGGVHPNEGAANVGRLLAKDVRAGDPVLWQDISR
jgi:N-acetylneuraminate synthase